MVQRGFLMSRNVALAAIEDDRLNILRADLLPLYFQLPGATLQEWLSMRSIDTGRTNSRLLRKTLGVRTRDKAEIALSMNAAMITDSYWIKTDENQTWESVCFTGNEFSGMAILGSFVDFNKPFSRTPELTSLGSFEKCWRLEEDGWWLYKLSPMDHLYSELCAHALCKLFRYPVAHYELLTEDPEELFGLSLSPGMGIIRTRDFTGGGAVNFEPAEALGLEDDDVLGNPSKVRAV